MSCVELFPLRFLKEGGKLGDPTETAGAGIPMNRGKHL